MSHLFEEVEQDWFRVRRTRRNATRLVDARRQAGNAATLAEMERYVRTAGSLDADRVLLALVRQVVSPVASEGGAPSYLSLPALPSYPSSISEDDLAARALLHLLLPGARRMAHRWWAIAEQDERAAIAVAAVYRRIRSYPLARRPGKVAANILMDAERELRRAARTATLDQEHSITWNLVDSDASWQMVVLENPGFGSSRGGARPVGPAHLDVELMELLQDAVSSRVLQPWEARLIGRSRVGGARVADLAAADGLRPRTMYERRSRAEQRLIDAYSST